MRFARIGVGFRCISFFQSTDTFAFLLGRFGLARRVPLDSGKVCYPLVPLAPRSPANHPYFQAIEGGIVLAFHLDCGRIALEGGRGSVSDTSSYLK